MMRAGDLQPGMAVDEDLRRTGGDAWAPGEDVERDATARAAGREAPDAVGDGHSPRFLLAEPPRRQPHAVAIGQHHVRLLEPAPELRVLACAVQRVSVGVID